MRTDKPDNKFAIKRASFLKLVAQVDESASKTSRVKTGNSLSGSWQLAITNWLTWLLIGGSPKTTLRVRREHVEMIARRTKVGSPAEVSLGDLINVCGTYQWSNEYRRSVRRSLDCFFQWAMDNGHAHHNPAEGLPRVSSGTPNPNPVPDDVWREILIAAPARERLMIRLAGEAGLRRAEVAKVKREDVLRTDKGWALVVNGKGSKQRLVPLTEKLAHAILKFNHGGYLFPGQDDGHLSPQWVGISVSALMPPGWSMHKLRHRYASKGLSGTGDLLAVSVALGHTSVATTQAYTKVVDERVRRVSEAAAD